MSNATEALNHAKRPKTSLEQLHLWDMLESMKVKLTVGEINALVTLLNCRRGRGGFQNLLAHLWYQLDENTGEIELSFLLAERIHRYAFAYGNADWRRNLRRIFRRTLGANLDRFFILQ